MTPAESQQLAWLNAPEPASTRLAPAERTPHTPAEVCEALLSALTRRLGTVPNPRTLAILMGQWAIETGHGASCWNNNLPNIRAPGTRGAVLCCQIPGGHVSEVIGGREYFFGPPSVGSTFRAFETLEAGADFYVDFLQRRFARAWPAVLRGDPDAYIDALHQPPPFFTADVNTYRRTFDSCFAHYLPLAQVGAAEGPVPVIPPEIVGATRAAALELWLQTLDMDQDESGASNIPAELDSADTDPHELAPPSQEEPQT